MLSQNKRRYEYGGSLVGITIGLIAGAIVVGAIVITNPALLVGIVGAVAGLLIIITATGIIGSIASRIGRLIDGYLKKPDNLNENYNCEVLTSLLEPSLKCKNLDELENQNKVSPKIKYKLSPHETKFSIFKNSFVNTLSKPFKTNQHRQSSTFQQPVLKRTGSG